MEPRPGVGAAENALRVLHRRRKPTKRPRSPPAASGRHSRCRQPEVPGRYRKRRSRVRSSRRPVFQIKMAAARLSCRQVRADGSHARRLLIVRRFKCHSYRRSRGMIRGSVMNAVDRRASPPFGNGDRDRCRQPSRATGLVDVDGVEIPSVERIECLHLPEHRYVGDPRAFAFTRLSWEGPRDRLLRHASTLIPARLRAPADDAVEAGLTVSSSHPAELLTKAMTLRCGQSDQMMTGCCSYRRDLRRSYRVESAHILKSLLPVECAEFEITTIDRRSWPRSSITARRRSAGAALSAVLRPPS